MSKPLTPAQKKLHGLGLDLLGAAIGKTKTTPEQYDTLYNEFTAAQNEVIAARNAPTTEASPLVKPAAVRVLDRPGYTHDFGFLPYVAEDGLIYWRDEDGEIQAEEPCLRRFCPDCYWGVVRNHYYHPEKGFLLRDECAQMLLDPTICQYYRVS